MEKFSSLMFIIKPYSHYHRYFDISLICKVIEKLLKNFKIFILLILFYSELHTHTKTLSARLLSLLYMYESSKKKKNSNISSNTVEQNLLYLYRAHLVLECPLCHLLVYKGHGVVFKMCKYFVPNFSFFKNESSNELFWTWDESLYDLFLMWDKDTRSVLVFDFQVFWSSQRLCT